MDYAKLALLKAEQLERQGQPVTTITRRAGLVFEQTVQPDVNFEICTLEGEGEAALIVSLQFEDGGDAGGRVEFRLGSKTVFVRPYSQTMMFMASAMLSGRLAVRIRTTKAMRLVSADVMVIGGDIINAAAQSVRVVQHGDCNAAVYVSDGKVLLSVGSGVPDLGDYVIAGFGQYASLAVLALDGQTRFAVCFADSDKNVFLTLTTKDGEILSCCRLSIRADALAIIGQESHLVLGYVYKGIAYAAIVAPPDFLPQMTTRLEEATSIEFVRECNPPAVVLGKNKSSVIRMAQSESASDEEIALLFEC